MVIILSIAIPLDNDFYNFINNLIHSIHFYTIYNSNELAKKEVNFPHLRR